MAYTDIIPSIIFILLILLLINQYTPKSIQFELYNLHKIMPYIQLKIGSPPVELNFKLSTIHSVLFLNNESEYDSNDSDTYKTRANTPIHPLIPFDRNSFSIAKESISFSTITIPSMAIVLVDEDTNQQNTLGISYLNPNNFPNDEYSFLYQLKLNGFIEREMISIHSNKDTYLIDIGDYPSEASESNANRVKKTKTCALIPNTLEGDNNPLYQCQFDSLYFKDNTIIPVKSRVTWLITGKTITVPIKVFDSIINKYFPSALESKECVLQGLSRQYLCCNVNYYNSALDNVGLIIGKWNVKLTIKELFIANIPNDKMVFIFEGKIYPEIKNTIEIGVNVFRRYIAMFNKEDKVFGLIEKDKELDI